MLILILPHQEPGSREGGETGTQRRRQEMGPLLLRLVALHGKQMEGSEMHCIWKKRSETCESNPSLHLMILLNYDTVILLDMNSILIRSKIIMI